MSEPGKAVFLSYASQDAEAAKRIADALRAAGVDVWFDQNELVGGDQWDQRIRGQIGSCALFVPVISANTQARLEGYFRLEWKIAAQRTHTMADEKAFLLPILIDDTRDADAKVPPEFRPVQWTRLPGGEGGATFAGRVQKLLSGEQVVGSRAPEAGRPVPPDRGNDVPAPNKPRPRWLLPVFGVLMIGLTVLAVTYLKPAPPALAVDSSTRPLSASGEVLRRIGEILNKTDVTRAELDLATDLLVQAAKNDPGNVQIFSTWTEVDCRYINENYDITPARRDAAQRHAATAMGIAPHSFAARYASALALENLAGRDSATKILQAWESLQAEEPRDPRVLNRLAWAARNAGRHAEAIKWTETLQQIPGWETAALFNRGLILTMNRDLDSGLRLISQAAKQEPAVKYMLWRAYIETIWLGDADAGQGTLAKIPAGFFLEDMPASAKYFIEVRARDYAAALATMRAIPRDFVESNAGAFPTAYLRGQALSLAGKTAAAEAEWRSALAAVDRRLHEEGNDRAMLMAKATVLAALGERAEADRSWRTVTELYGPSPGHWLSLYYAAHQLSNDELIEWLARKDKSLFWSTAAELRIDPLFDRVRDDSRFAALLKEAEADPQRAPQPAKVSPEGKSVAVLAFANLSDDKANEYFSDGISEELLNVLAKVPGLKVSARTSAFYFKGKEVPIPEIAKQLGVAYVVEGSVRKAGDKVRITAQLIKAADGFHVWSDTFTRDLKDIFAVQDEIAGLIAKNLELKLGQAVGVTVAGAMDPEAFRLYLQGREAWNRRDAAGFRQAELLFHRALELDPRFARAHAALADVWLLGAVEPMGGYAQRQSPLLMRAIAKAEQAVAMDEKSAEAHASLGHVLGYAWRSADARRALQRAIELNPNYASAHQWLGRVHLEQGELEEGIAMLRRAMELDPLSHRILDNYADALECAGRPEEAWAMLGRAAALHPSGVQIRCKQALLLQRLGRREEALAAARALAADTAADDPDYRHSTAVAVLSACGETAEAEASLRRIAQDSEDYPIALLNIGRTREFTAHLDYASINWIHNFWFHPEFAAARAEPGVRAWTEKVGLAEALARAESWLAAHPARDPEAKR